MINYEYRGGRVAGQPELKATQNGTPYLRFRMANDDSAYNEQTQQWDKKSEHFITILVWPAKRKGEMVNLPAMLAESLNPGTSVQVWGKFATRSWEADDGSRRSVEEFTARAVAVDVLDVLPWQQLDGAQQGAQPQQQQQPGGSWGGGQNLQQMPQQQAQQQAPAPQQQQQQAQPQQGAVWGSPSPAGGGVPY